MNQILINDSKTTARVEVRDGALYVPARIATTEPMKYHITELAGVDGVEEFADSNGVVTVYRDEAMFSNEQTIKSYLGAPVTLGHPKDSEGNLVVVDSENYRDYTVGSLMGEPTFDGKALDGELLIQDKEALDAVESGTVEVSPGYIARLEIVGDGDDRRLTQVGMTGNHIAIVSKARGGHNVRLADEDGESMKKDDKPEVTVEVNMQDHLKLVEDLKAAQSELEALRAEKDKLVADSKADVAGPKELIQAMMYLGDDATEELLTGDFKKNILAKSAPGIVTEGKSDAYIAAAYDMLLSGFVSGNTGSTKQVADDAGGYKDPVMEARARSMAKNLG